MIDIEKLYFDKRYNNLLNMLARKASIHEQDFEDFKQSVFLECLDSNVNTLQDCERGAKKIAQRQNRFLRSRKDGDDNIRTFSFDENRDGYFNDIDGVYQSPLWEDTHIV